jgi:hypothetical protein
MATCSHHAIDAMAKVHHGNNKQCKAVLDLTQPSGYLLRR